MLQHLQHSVIRRRANLKDLPLERFQVGIARGTEDYAQAFNLVQVSYAALGIAQLGKTLYRMTEQHVLPEAVVLLAKDGCRVVGTITVTFDSPAGLPLGLDFPSELGTLRKQGARLAEIGSYAVVQRARHSGVSQLLSLAAARLIWSHDCTHTVVGIHPKATPIYSALWGFEALADSKVHQDLAAPVRAMILSREVAQAHGRRYYGRCRAGGYPIPTLVFGACPELPSMTSERDTRMARETFQTLFLKQSDHLDTLRPPTLAYLRQQRTDETLGPFATEQPLDDGL